MAEYLKVKYNLNLKHLDQPILQINTKAYPIFLPTELCRDASLPDNFTNDRNKMKDLQDFKISHPEQRFKLIIDLINRLFNAPEFA